ncbi:MAG: twin-arginine translocation pathway signal protein [Alphaproteobacteria bacterium]
MASTRRDFIRTVGGVGVAAAAVGLLAGCDEVDDEVTAAWRGPAAGADLRRRLLGHALLAPNPHNMQPWLVDLREADTITLYCDRERLLPETDPHGRQIMIGHGTFLEQLDLAASAAGVGTEIALFPDGDYRDGEIGEVAVARVRLTPDAGRTRDPLFEQIRHRRSTKEPFDERPLAAADAAALGEALAGDPRLTIVHDGDLPPRLRSIITEAWDIEATTPRTHQESVDRMRIGAAEIAAHRDGIDLAGPLFWWGKLLGMINRQTMADPTSFAFKSGMDMYHQMFATTPAFAWLSTPGNDRRTQVMAGRAYARLNLQATALGVALHPVSQVLQEYPEMAALQARFLDDVGEQGRTVQMLARLGYAATPKPSPRRRLDDIIMS